MYANMHLCIKYKKIMNICLIFNPGLGNVHKLHLSDSLMLYTVNQSVKCLNEWRAVCVCVCVCVYKSCASPPYLITMSAESP